MASATRWTIFKEKEQAMKRIHHPRIDDQTASRITEATEKARAALADLQACQSPSAVASLLLSRKALGNTCDPWGCPVSRLLLEAAGMTDFYVWTNPGGSGKVIFFYGDPGKPGLIELIQERMSTALSTFTDEFDEGQYPQLVDR